MAWGRSPACPHGRRQRRDCGTCVAEERLRKAHLDSEGRRIAEAVGGRSLYRSTWRSK